MSRAAIRYAKAILDLAVSKGASNQVNDDMKQIAETFSGNSELSAFIQNPTIRVADKEAVIGKIFGSSEEVTKSMFRLLHDNKRFEIIGDIAVEFNRQFNEMNNMQTVQVTTAVAMDKAMEEKVLEKVRTFTSKNLIVENIVDPEIIGGFILRIGDMQFNASVSDKLKSLKREFSLN